MQKTSPYVNAVPTIVADMEREREQDEQQTTAPVERESTIAGGAQPTIYRYQVEGGGIVLSSVPLEGEDDQPSTVDAEPQTDQRPETSRQPPYFLHFLLLLFVFVCLDNVDSVMAYFAPTVTITLTPVVRTITTTGQLTLGGAGSQVQGRLLPPLTLSQSQIVVATGKGYQKAVQATGTLIYFNGSFASQTIPAGTTYTGADGVQVATNETVTIPPANSPYVGQASVPAHAILAGAGGNIQAGDIATTTNTLQVRNDQFQNGRDARDFPIVTKADIDQPAGVLKAQVTQSMQAALQGQLRSGELLLPLPCQPVTSANYNAGDEAQSVALEVSETCNGVAYDATALQTAATKILTRSAVRQLGSYYQLYGQVQVQETAAATHNKTVGISFRVHGKWVYQINEQHIKVLIEGKPRLTALHLVAQTPGVRSVNIAGVEDNTQLPTDANHIHLVIFAEV